MTARTLKSLVFMGLALMGSISCADKELDASGEPGVVGESCEPEGGTVCAEGLACEPVSGSDAHVCSARVEIRGSVINALDDAPIEGALVVAADELGMPVTAVVRTDAEGRYTLPVSVRRDDTGEIAETQRWTLLVSAADYLPFPGAVRPALPINAQDAVAEDEEPTLQGAIDNASTVVALIPAANTTGATISGRVEANDPSGTLVVVEGVEPASLAVADLDGAFTLFNVQPGAATIRGYRRGLELTPWDLEIADADVSDVMLSASVEDTAQMSVVRGMVNIVNAPGNSSTSVVLVPSSTFHEVFERGPVPAGLRAPAPPDAPTITSTFEIDGVPPGRYHVLAAFENDALVRDPDESIAGTQIQQIEVVAGQDVALDEGFKITEALEVVSPGAEAPELVSGTPTLVWADDSGEDRYEVVVRDALGEELWRDDQILAVMGSSTVEVEYGGPALTPGMYYQFRVTSWKDNPNGSSALARTEDLRGVFVAQ